MTFSMSVVDKSARLALEAEDEENAMSSKVGPINSDKTSTNQKEYCRQILMPSFKILGAGRRKEKRERRAG